MILEYRAVATGEVLDRVYVETPEIRYESGRARDTVEMVLRRGGLDALPGWTNGYVQLVEAS